MTLLVSGCSFSSGWGFDDKSQTWPEIVSRQLNMPVVNLAQTASNNADIFLSAVKSQKQSHQYRLVQWTGLNRISVSPSPIDTRKVLSVHDHYLEKSALGISSQEIKSFSRVLAALNQDWKPYFDLIDMIEILQQDPNTYFINGLLHWDHEFFNHNWAIPLSKKNNFLESLLLVDRFDDNQLAVLLNQVLQARDRIDRSRWINLETNWNLSKVDSVSHEDYHPGPLSQIKFANQVLDYILS